MTANRLRCTAATRSKLAWTVVPVLIVMVLFLATARTIFEIERAAARRTRLRVTVVGHQWWWEFRYPDLGIVTANELHLPVSESGERRPTILRLESVDVVHSFWLPQLNGKTDVIPNHPNTMWVEPLRAGTYYGQCAEYCGTQHAHMLIRVVVHAKGEFDAWAAAQRALPAERRGRGARGVPGHRLRQLPYGAGDRRPREPSAPI